MPSGPIQDYPEEIFANSPLALVVAQVTMPALQRIRDDDFRRPFEEAVLLDYPIRRQHASRQLVIKDDDVAAQEGPTHYRFYSIDLKWAVVLGEEFIALECRDYKHVDDLASHLTSVLRLAERHFKLKYQVRFGLRYINELRYPKGGDVYQTWRGLLNPEIVGFDAADHLGGEVVHAIAELRLRRTVDGQQILNIRRGFLTGSTIPPLPKQEPKTGPFYLLDLEYFDENQGAFEVDPVRTVRSYNKYLYNIFRWAIDCDKNKDLYSYFRGQS